MRKRKVVWVLINVSHYHEARWAAFARLSNYQASVIEIANRDAGFVQLESESKNRFDRVTLFPSVHWREITARRRQKAISAALNKIDPDVVCINGWSIGGALASLYWCLKRGRRCVIFSESNASDKSRSPMVERIKKRLIGLGDAALVGGTAARTYLMDLGFSLDRLFVGYDVVDNHHFARRLASGKPVAPKPELAPDGPFFIAAARFEEKKNHGRLLEAYALYRTKAGSDAWPLVILGDGSLRPTIEVERSRLALNNAVVLPGFIGYQELPSWYQSASCFVHPSTTEQWGLVVNEAMAAGLPVLVSERCGCAADLVEEGVNGFTFDPFVPAQLAMRMYRLAHQENNAMKMGRESQRVIADWGPECFASGLSQAVEAALSAPAKRPDIADKLLLLALSNR